MKGAGIGHSMVSPCMPTFRKETHVSWHTSPGRCIPRGTRHLISPERAEKDVMILIPLGRGLSTALLPSVHAAAPGVLAMHATQPGAYSVQFCIY